MATFTTNPVARFCQCTGCTPRLLQISHPNRPLLYVGNAEDAKLGLGLLKAAKMSALATPRLGSRCYRLIRHRLRTSPTLSVGVG